MEAAQREILEETGFHVAIERLSDVYSKYEEIDPNGDIAQPIVHFFVCRVTDCKLRTDPLESLDVDFFDVEHMPSLYSPIHQTAWLDFLSGTEPVFR